MPATHFWDDPKTWIAAGAICVTILSLTYTILSNYWNRHESRLDALAKVLRPLARAAQHLDKANKSRQKREQLRISFPNQQTAQEASKRLEMFMGEYSDGIKD